MEPLLKSIGIAKNWLPAQFQGVRGRLPFLRFASYPFWHVSKSILSGRVVSLLSILFVTGSLLARAQVLINELLVNPMGTDDDREFIELRNVNGPGAATNLALVQINGNGSNAGIVDEVWRLDALHFGVNGLLLLGHNYNIAPRGGSWANLVSPFTVCGDPPGFATNDLANSSCTWLVVSNCSPTLIPGTDLDTNNDGVLDLQPWSNILDSVGWTDGDTGDRVYTPASLTQNRGTPDAATRFPANEVPFLKAAWYNGDLVTNATDQLGRTYDASRCSPNLPTNAVLTPGELNYPFFPISTNVRLNEVYLNPVGNSNNLEFIELVSPLQRRENLWGLWLLVVDSRGTNRGVILECWNLSGLSTGTNGLALFGNRFSYPSPGGPWSNIMETATLAAEPIGPGATGWADGDLRDDDDFTLLLVAQFSGKAGDDLDWDDDLRIDRFLWTELIDSVGIGQTYAPAALHVPFSPDAFGRRSDDFAAHSTTAWYGGEIAGQWLSVVFDPLKSFNCPPGARLTPGRANYPLEPDSDRDGLPDWWEELYFGGRTNAQAREHSDSDPFDNFQEYIADTDPTDGASYFKVIANLPDPDRTTWSFAIYPGSPRRIYDVFWTPDLRRVEWRRLGFAVTGKAEGLILTVTNTGTAGFYRTGVLLP